MDCPAWNLAPEDIESRSFAIIDREAGEHGWPPSQWSLVRRLIHTSADFDYARDTVISPGAIEAAISALAGISQARLSLLPKGCQAVCLIGDKETRALARETGVTRALAAVDLAFRLIVQKERPAIWVIGNAPTALYRLLERLEGEPDLPRPALVIGLPVGFVNAYESKMALMSSDLPYYVTNRSRKGGSNAAAAALNALARLFPVPGEAP
jgi:precorrin-8X/cobalt-precorrin-8 methylmutase